MAKLIFPGKGRLLGTLRRRKTVEGITKFRVKKAPACNQKLYRQLPGAAPAANLQRELPWKLKRLHTPMRNPGTTLPARPRRAAAAAGSRIDAVFEALEVVFDDLDTGGCRQKVDGSALVEPDGRALEPLFRFGA
jgi:hypothetical protein